MHSIVRHTRIKIGLFSRRRSCSDANTFDGMPLKASDKTYLDDSTASRTGADALEHGVMAEDGLNDQVTPVLLVPPTVAVSV
jgi:hypothetical protein